MVKKKILKHGESINIVFTPEEDYGDIVLEAYLVKEDETIVIHKTIERNDTDGSYYLDIGSSETNELLGDYRLLVFATNSSQDFKQQVYEEPILFVDYIY